MPIRRSALHDLRACKLTLKLLSQETADLGDMKLAYWLDVAACYVASAYTRSEGYVAELPARTPLTYGESRAVEVDHAE